MNIQLSEYTGADEGAVNRVALAAFQQYQDQYQEWEQFSPAASAQHGVARGLR